MEEVGRGCLMSRVVVGGWMFLLVQAYPGSPGQRAINQLCVCAWCRVRLAVHFWLFLTTLQILLQLLISTKPSGKSGPKDQVALHYYYTSPSHWCTTHEVSKS